MPKFLNFFTRAAQEPYKSGAVKNVFSVKLAAWRDGYRSGSEQADSLESFMRFAERRRSENVELREQVLHGKPVFYSYRVVPIDEQKVDCDDYGFHAGGNSESPSP